MMLVVINPTFEKPELFETYFSTVFVVPFV
jgi:hypothetical protein